MAGIQSSINSMIGSASRAVMAVRGYQALKARKTPNIASPKVPTVKTSVPQTPAPAATSQNPQRVSMQQMAAQQARQSAADAVAAKKTQRRNFMEYLKKQPSSVGTVGDLPATLQKKIASQYTPRMRQDLMNRVDQEVQVKNGQHKQRNSKR